MNKTFVTLLVLVVLVGGFFLISKGKKLEAPTTEKVNETVTPSPIATPEPVATPSPSTTPVQNTPAVKEFTVTGSNFSFSPKSLSVNQGDKVKITFKNSNGLHNLIIDEFNVGTDTIQAGAEDTIEFTADKVGSFQYYCSVGNHRAMGMWGTLTVK